VAVVAAVSPAQGLIAFEMKESSFKAIDFSNFLEKLADKVSHRPLTVLLDNCSIHKARVSKTLAQRLKIDLLWNVPYRPELNGIEFVWSIAKRRFRRMQLQRMLGTLALTFE